MENANGKFTYVTIGSENVVKVYRRGEKPELVNTIATGDLPHGIWGSGDGTRVYVGLENQDAVSAIDTLSNKILSIIPVGQQPQALVYVPDAVRDGAGTTNLVPLGDAGNAAHLTLVAPKSGSPARATVSVNAIGTLDLLQAAVSGLKPGHTYTLWLVTSRTEPFGTKETLVTFKTNLAGAQVTQAIGPLRQVLAGEDVDSRERAKERFLVLTEADSETPELIQQQRNSR